MKRNIFKIILNIFLVQMSLSGCEEFLDVKPNLNLEVPEDIESVQAILDAESRINVSTALDIMAADEYYLLPEIHDNLDLMYQSLHIWDMDPEIYLNGSTNDWNRPYQIIFAANFCISQLDKIGRNPSNLDLWDNLKGRSFFVRAHAFADLVKQFAPQYDPATAQHILAVPMPLEADVNSILDFGNLLEVYDQILLDIENSLSLLPELPRLRSQPSKAAAYGLQARVFLMMKDYPKALEASENALAIQNTLLDFSTLNPQSNYPVPRGNGEVIYHTLGATYSGMTFSAETRIDPDLFNMYHFDDLRRGIYFFSRPQGQINFKGSFNTGHQYFTGITVGEMLLTKAECAFRGGDSMKAEDAINTFLESRFKKGSFTPVSLNSLENPLKFLLDERKKELLFRGRRWADIKRLTGDSGYKMEIKRVLGDRVYTLPDDPMMQVLPVPPNEFANR
ncbi:RagB/SusD family nutrient uptake outer membrane protein [Aquiflexum sp.]|uniref:RagB/SusD family nutrient uptake outer membrane protein n=1 Tax=Aquiflexum sp. TaxID=1872584 RepID=UPI003593C303